MAKASAKELSASYSARLNSCPDGELGGVLFAARHGLAEAGMQLKYMGSKSWLAPHLDLLLGDVSVLRSPFFGSGKLEYYLARRRLASALSLCQVASRWTYQAPISRLREFCTKCLLVHPTPAGCAMRWQAS